MPRRKKLDESPARAPGGGPAGGSVSSNTGSRQPQSFDSIMATHTLPSMSVKEQIVQNMQEMFANVDPDVIYMVLSECDFKVENAMDSLLELSVTVEPPVSGFEHTAAVLLNSQQSSQSHLGPGEPGNPSTKPDLLTEELDLLVDEELDLLAAQRDINERPSGDTSSVHAPEGSQQALPEMVRSSLMGPPTAELWQKLNVEHLLTETPAEVKGSLDFAASGRPSAFQLYKKPDSSQSAPDNTTTMQPNITPQRQLYSQVFTPQHTSNPSFITPVVPPSRPPPWVNWAPVNPSPTASLPKSWALPAPPLDVAGSRRLRLEGKVLVLLRGAPGSGKSTLARAFKEHNPGAVILSTDDFFLHNGQYQFNPNALGEAHEWNHERAKEAFRGGVNPIIIDNTNTQGWEMKPYVALALKHNYKVHFREPDTWWKNKPRELERRSRHDVPVERIRRMLDNYEGFVSVHSIMGSALPETKQRLPVELVTADNKCPDLVGGFGRTHLSSSLPDVSSIRSTEEGKGEDKGHEFNIDSLQTDDPVVESVDSKVSLLPLGADEQIPDCIVESVMSEDLHGNEIPVAFCDSIKQRERRERPSRKSEFEKKDQSLKVQSEMNEGEKREVGKTEEQERDLNFEGDWPTEGTLEQRTVRKRERQKEEGRSQDMLQGHTGPNFTEFQKLLDVIQTGEIQAYNTSEEGSSEEDPGSESHINPPESTEELAADTMEGNLDQAKVEFSGAAVLKLDSTDAARLSDAEVSTSVEGEGKIHSVVGEDEGGIAAQIDTNMSHSKEDVNSATGCGNDACEETGLGGQGRKQRRRSGKQCKLAPNFPPDHSLEPLQGPDTKDLCENSESFEITATKVPDEHSEQQHCPPRIDGGCVTQTEPQDFALLWRLDHRNSSDKTLDTVSSFSNGFKVMEGSSSRFVPESSSRVHVEVPYHVVHEKGTQVEENDFGSFQDRLESLRILSLHFKLVTFDTLEDLYDKCHQDLEWTTNLLLDSGEKFFKEEEPVERTGVFGVTNDQISTLIKSEDLLTETNTGSAEDVDAMEPPTEISESKDVGLICSGVGKPQLSDPDSQLYSDDKTFQEEPSQAEKPEIAHVLQTPEHDIDDEACVGNSSRDKDIDTQSMDEIHRLLQAELDVIETAEKQKSCDKHPAGERRSQHVDIRCVEMTLPTEVALQLTELFGPVGVDPDTCSTDEYTVQLDLNLAKLLHQQWKDTIQDRHRQAALSFHLLQENKAPKMDHWCAPHQPVSLRDIIKEEQALQRNVEKSRQDRSDIDKRDGATLLKENQLFAKFPTIDRHFLQDIFRDHNYSLAHTEMFLHSLLDDAPAKTVVAPVTPRPDHQRAASRERDKQNPPESKVAEYQDTEEPQYEDFRAEARLQRRRQLESFSKAAEAFKQGRKEVASFYAQQGHLHGQSMREANYRAAIQIFEKVNSSLLPQNILDLHGLHVEEALQHLDRVLQAKTKEYEQGLGRPQLSVITGKGNHSQGGVARIRPAVIDYLNNRHYRFTEPNPGLVLVSLK